MLKTRAADEFQIRKSLMQDLIELKLFCGNKIE